MDVFEAIARRYSYRGAFTDQPVPRDDLRKIVQAGIQALLGKGRARRGMLEGDLVEGELEIGQVAGLIRDVPRVSDLVDQLVAGYAAAIDRLAPGPRR